MKNRILSVLLATMLALSMFVCAAVAEEATIAENTISLTDSTLYIGDKTYAFPVSIAELTEMGVSVPDVSGLTKGQYYYDLDVDDSRNGFSLRVDYLTSTEDPYWATGVNLNSDEHAGMSVGGMVLGETTREEIISACGADYYGCTYDADSLTYYALNMNCIWNLQFEGQEASSKLTKVAMHNELVTNYGIVDASNAGVEETDLPAVSELAFNEFILDGKYYAKGATVQDLLDDGWVLPAGHEADSMVAAKDGSIVNGDRVWMYNGVSLVKVSAFNTTDAECRLADCIVNSIYVDVCNNASIVCADGLANGVSTYDEAVAILGEPSSTTDGENGFKNVKFTVINSVTYEIGVNADGCITYITIDCLL